MKVLVACEYSGIVRNAFAALGHDAWSCDILPTESEGNHIQDDILKHLDKGWDLEQKFVQNFGKVLLQLWQNNGVK